ncbi:MAG: sensor histidine kinase [Dehalococcoidales bacterium]|nr:sensor histidine kinase [Dehalococcoidales bacterium]
MKIIRKILGWFDIHPGSADFLITLAFAVLALLNLYVNWGVDTQLSSGYAIILTLLVVLPLILRRRYPLGVLTFMSIALAVFRSLNIPESSFTLYALLLAYFGAGAYGQKEYRNWVRVSTASLIIGLLVYSIFFQQRAADVPARTILYQLSVVFLNVFLFGAAWWIGEVFRSRQQREMELQERTMQLEKERDENARRAVMDERVRIARELHDVVAHHVSVMGIQAGAARRILKQQPEKANDVLIQIEASSRQAVAELQRLLGFLREQNQVDDITPQPGLKQLDALVAQMRLTGLPVSVLIEGEAKDLPSGVDLSAYRIIQEALTNTLKHAGPANASVVIKYLGAELELEIRDDGKNPAPEITNKGRGLIGMRERVTLHGGEFQAGPLPEGGFMITARLPLTGWIK